MGKHKISKDKTNIGIQGTNWKRLQLKCPSQRGNKQLLYAKKRKTYLKYLFVSSISRRRAQPVQKFWLVLTSWKRRSKYEEYALNFDFSIFKWKMLITLEIKVLINSNRKRKFKKIMSTHNLQFTQCGASGIQ